MESLIEHNLRESRNILGSGFNYAPLKLSFPLHPRCVHVIVTPPTPQPFLSAGFVGEMMHFRSSQLTFALTPKLVRLNRLVGLLVDCDMYSHVNCRSRLGK